MGLAKISVPSTDNCQGFDQGDLSDQVAMSYGRLFALTLSDKDAYVTVVLTSGSVRIIGLDAATGELTIGRLAFS